MDLSLATVRASVIYQHLIRVISPRPIAWVSTVSGTGIFNLAPFSFFSGVGSRPPSLMFCPANRRDGSQKDTLRNLLESGEFVVNVVNVALASAMNQTSCELPSDQSEFDFAALETSRSVVVKAPGVALSPVRLECQLMHHLILDDGPGGANVVVGRIVHLYIDDSVLDSTGYADPRSLNLIGRLGGASYCRTTEAFDLLPPVN